MPMHMGEDEFADLVDEVFSGLAPEVTERLDNVLFTIEDRSANGEALLGLYDGVPETDRGEYGFGEMPDRIILYRVPLLDDCSTLPELREQVRITLMHEIGHYFGMTDERLTELGWG